MKFPKSRKKEKSASEMDLDDLQAALNMTDTEFEKFLKDYGFAED